MKSHVNVVINIDATKDEVSIWEQIEAARKLVCALPVEKKPWYKRIFSRF